MSFTHTTRSGLDVIEITNERLSLAFLPQIGGRLISLLVDGCELLWRNPAWLADDLTPLRPHADWPATDGTMGSWANVGGSKTWPAPQGNSTDTDPDRWPGPPDPVLDAGPYDVQLRESQHSTVLTLTSAHDQRTGISITREFNLPLFGSSFTHKATLTNIADHPVRWSAWEVTQVDTHLGGEIVIDVVGEDGPNVLLIADGSPIWTESAGHIRVPTQNTVAKLGFPHARGRIAWHRSDGVRLVQDTHVEDGATYPDDGCPVELWLQHPLAEPLPAIGGLQPDAHLVELETLSPLRTLALGDSVSLTVNWQCAVVGVPAEVG